MYLKISLLEWNETEHVMAHAYLNEHEWDEMQAEADVLKDQVAVTLDHYEASVGFFW